MDWFRDHMVETWMVLAIALGVAELFSLDLILLMLGAGAVVGAGTALLGLPLPVQILAALATSVAMLAAVRPSVVKRLHTGPSLVQGHDKLVGRTAVVTSEISEDGGQVRIGGEVWSAVPFDDTVVISVGSRVDIFEIRGATLVVHKIPELDS